MHQFKIESEGGLFDVYEISPEGPNCVSKGELSLRCVLARCDVPAAEALQVPSFLDLATSGPGVKQAA